MSGSMVMVRGMDWILFAASTTWREPPRVYIARFGKLDISAGTKIKSIIDQAVPANY